MTGNEKRDNQFREIALIVMLVVMFLFREDNLFVLYGLCIQALLEESGKYYYVSKWMGHAPVHVKTYISWWILPGSVIGISYWKCINHSIVAMIVSAGIVFVIEAGFEIKKMETDRRKNKK